MNGHHPDTTEIFDLGGKFRVQNSAYRFAYHPLFQPCQGLEIQQEEKKSRTKYSKLGVWLSRVFCGKICTVMEKLRFLIFASLLAVIFLLPGFSDAQPAAEQDSMTAAPNTTAEEAPLSSSATLTITMRTPPLPAGYNTDNS